jgi:thioredoxin reductase (NADPH)
MDAKIYDIIIIGGGAAGLSAGIYGARAGMKTLLLERGLIGGLAATTDLIENYPGFPEGINGKNLTEKMKEQAQRFDVEIIQSEVLTIHKRDKIFDVKTHREVYVTKTVILAVGTVPKKLNIPGEDELRGRGVSYCATCDGPLFRDKNIAVIGCGNSGLQEARFLLKFVKHITLIEWLPYITADVILQEHMRREPHVKCMLNSKIVSINGKDRVSSVTVQDRTSKHEQTIDVDGVFIYIGFNPLSDIVRDIVDIDRDGFIVTNQQFETSVPGIFAAGDIRSKKIRQVVTACAEGAEAAINAHHYIDSLQ